MKIKANNFNISQTIECGQMFRYKKIGENHYIICASDKILEIKQNKDIIDFINIPENEYYNVWENFFDLNTDYNFFKEDILKHEPKMESIIEYGKGLKILNQNKIETIISFIISQNRKMIQTKNSINNICYKIGNKIQYKKEDYYLFPSLDNLSKMSILDFKECKTGFRDKYLYDAILKINNNIVNINSKDIYSELLKIKGIGPKVASCICLFGYHDFSIFPVDTWIYKFMKENYNIENIKDIDTKSVDIFGKYRGLAQQYIFNYVVNNKNIYY